MIKLMCVGVSLSRRGVWSELTSVFSLRSRIIWEIIPMVLYHLD